MRERRLNNTIPDGVLKLLVEMGSDLSAARRARKMSQEDLAERLCVSRKLVHGMERGDPKIGIAAYVSAAWILGLERNLVGVFGQENDPYFQREARLSLPTRIRAPEAAPDDLDF